MSDPAAVKLDPAQLEAFYRSLQGYDVEAKVPLPRIVGELMPEVSSGHILPDLGNGWADNVTDRQQDESKWSENSRVFRSKLDVFFHVGSENRREVLSVICDTLLTRAKDFSFHGHYQATRYFARSAANRVRILLDPVRTQDDLDLIMNTVVGPQRSHATVPGPESNADRYLLQESIRRALGTGEPGEESGPSYADRWLVLHLLRDDGGYEYKEIAAALHVMWPDKRGESHTLKALCEVGPETSDDEYRVRINAIRSIIEGDDNWSRSGPAPNQIVKPPPRHPLDVWNELREGYSLPSYLPATKAEDAICRWMPPPAVTDGSLRLVYWRGSKILKRRFPKSDGDVAVAKS